MARCMVVTHGGTDSKPEESDGTQRAAQANQTALHVAQWLQQGMPLQQAMDRGRDLTPAGLKSALIGVTPDDAAISMRKPMAHTLIKGG